MAKIKSKFFIFRVLHSKNSYGFVGSEYLEFEFFAEHTFLEDPAYFFKTWPIFKQKLFDLNGINDP